MTGTTPEAWNNPTKGAELTKAQIDGGADVVYQAAGGTGIGVLQAAADAGLPEIYVPAVNPYMVGASAGVMSIFIFISTYSPDLEVRLILFNIKLRYLGIAFVLLDIIQIPYGNSGGHIAHLGGAFYGFIYAQRLQKGVDIGLPFEKLIIMTYKLFYSKLKLNTVDKKEVKLKTKKNNISIEKNQKKIDEILDKISQSGYESLSKEEKDFLFKVGKK